MSKNKAFMMNVKCNSNRKFDTDPNKKICRIFRDSLTFAHLHQRIKKFHIVILAQQ